MFNAISDFVKRQRSTLAYVTLGTLSIYALGKYAQCKVEEFAEKAELDRLQRENLMKRFEQNQQDCILTVLSILPSIADYLFDELNVEKLTEILKRTRNLHTSTSDKATTVTDASTVVSSDLLAEKKAKFETWEKLKIQTFTRTITGMYALVLISMFIRIQINLIGRFTYLDSVQTLESGDLQTSSFQVQKSADSLSFEMERKYLSLSWFFLHRGLKELRKVVESAVRRVVGSVPLSSKVSRGELSTLLRSIRDLVEIEGSPSSEQESASARSMLPFLLPQEGEEATVLRASLTMAKDLSPENPVTVEPDLKRLLDETRDYIESPDFQKVFQASVSACFQLAEQPYDDMYHVAADKPPAKEETKPFASLLPEMTRLAHTVLNGHPNVYAKAVANVPSLRAFSAIIFSAFE